MGEIMNWLVAGFIIGFCCGVYIQEKSAKERYLESGAIAVYEGKATCEKALDQLVCNVRRN